MKHFRNTIKIIVAACLLYHNFNHIKIRNLTNVFLLLEERKMERGFTELYMPIFTSGHRQIQALGWAAAECVNSRFVNSKFGSDL